jgi:hypothetical protein
MRKPLAALAFSAVLVYGALLLILAATGHAAVKHPTDAWPLHHGTTAAKSSRGPRVAELQYLLRAPRPKANAWTHIAGTLKPCDKGRHGSCTKGIYDLPTAKGVIAWKFRAGYPARGQCGSKVDEWRQTKITSWFIHLVRTGKGRSYCWAAFAAKRIAAAENQETAVAKRLADFEFAQIRSGRYIETGYNRGPGVDELERYFGLLGEPWCAIEQNYALRHIGQALLPALPNNPFFVPNIIAAGAAHLRHSSLQSIARPGEWVLYYHDISHIGYVVSVDLEHGKPTGYYWTIEGNWNDRLAEVHHSPYDHLHYFFAVRGIAPK